MPRERLSMRKIREVLRLRLQCGLTKRQIATSCHIGLGTVYEYIRRSRDAGLSWPLPEDLTDEELDKRLFPPPPDIPSEQRPRPDWPALAQELRKKGVTLLLLWYEYRAVHPDGYGYSRFCELYNAWAGAAEPRMRCVHKAGEKLFVDYAGLTVPLIDPKSGEVTNAEVFVATWGASSFIYAEATLTQTLPDWIGSHVRAFEHFGGVPQILVPDNLKGGVTSPCFYEPDINATYQQMASYYGIAVIPARVRTPRDKAKVENGVQQVERWVLAPLRHLRFFCLADINAAIRPLLEFLNAKPAPGLGASRLQIFQQLDRPAMKPLPAEPYELALWRKARVHVDYHVAVERHFYSVPFQLIGQEVEVRLTQASVEFFHHGGRVASHVRSHNPNSFTTLPEHMPANHREWGQWNPERIARWAEKTGPQTAQLVREVLASRPHPYQGYRSCLGILRLGDEFGYERLEAAAGCALSARALSFKSVKSILLHRLDAANATARPGSPNQPTPPTAVAIEHPNIRGAAYYQSAHQSLPTDLTEGERSSLTDVPSPNA